MIHNNDEKKNESPALLHQIEFRILQQLGMIFKDRMAVESLPDSDEKSEEKNDLEVNLEEEIFRSEVTSSLSNDEKAVLTLIPASLSAEDKYKKILTNEISENHGLEAKYRNLLQLLEQRNNAYNEMGGISVTMQLSAEDKEKLIRNYALARQGQLARGDVRGIKVTETKNGANFRVEKPFKGYASLNPLSAFDIRHKKWLRFTVKGMKDLARERMATIREFVQFLDLKGGNAEIGGGDTIYILAFSDDDTEYGRVDDRMDLAREIIFNTRSGHFLEFAKEDRESYEFKPNATLSGLDHIWNWTRRLLPDRGEYSALFAMSEERNRLLKLNKNPAKSEGMIVPGMLMASLMVTCWTGTHPEDASNKHYIRPAFVDAFLHRFSKEQILQIWAEIDMEELRLSKETNTTAVEGNNLMKLTSRAIYRTLMHSGIKEKQDIAVRYMAHTTAADTKNASTDDILDNAVTTDIALSAIVNIPKLDLKDRLEFADAVLSQLEPNDEAGVLENIQNIQINLINDGKVVNAHNLMQYVLPAPKAVMERVSTMEEYANVMRNMPKSEGPNENEYSEGDVSEYLALRIGMDLLELAQTTPSGLKKAPDWIVKYAVGDAKEAEVNKIKIQSANILPYLAAVKREYGRELLDGINILNSRQSSSADEKKVYENILSPVFIKMQLQVQVQGIEEERENNNSMGS